jgi:hypothetical protein
MHAMCIVCNRDMPDVEYSAGELWIHYKCFERVKVQGLPPKAEGKYGMPADYKPNWARNRPEKGRPIGDGD